MATVQANYRNFSLLLSASFNNIVFMDRETEERYKIERPATWAPQLSDGDILAAVAESDFSRRQHEEGRDFCYFLKKTQYNF